jgi:hypothetical protein
LSARDAVCRTARNMTAWSDPGGPRHQIAIDNLVRMTSGLAPSLSLCKRIYIASDDEYRCPAGQQAIKRFTTIERGMTLSKYWSSRDARA